MLETVLGQPEGVSYLRKVIDDSFTLPLLLAGPEGVGRRFSVYQAARTLFEADQHFALEHGHHPDVHLVQVEEDKDIKVESIRGLIEETAALPSWAPYKFLIVDGADRLTTAAANALLKVLEEPPPKTRFFLISDRLKAVIPTIRSRCAVVSYKALPEDLILSRLLQLTSDEVKARVCTRASEGSLGIAMRYLVSGQLVFRDEIALLLDHTSRKDLCAAFSAVDKVTDLRLGLRFLGQLLHDVVVVDVAAEKVIHLDMLETLRRLKMQLTSTVVQRLVAELRDMRRRVGVAPVNLSFHVKTVLASVCA